MDAKQEGREPADSKKVVPITSKQQKRPAFSEIESRGVKLVDGVTLYVLPGEMMSAKEFVRWAPPNSIALDGFVQEQPFMKPTAKGTWANYDHHKGVYRGATKATCAQVLAELQWGLKKAFTRKGKLEMNIFINDPDQDTALAVWLFANHHRVSGMSSEPLINRLVGIEDGLDARGGAYPIDPESPIMQEVAWIFEPYVKARMTGRLGQMDHNEMANVIDAVGKRIDKYSMGDGEKVPLDTRYESIGGGLGWTMVKETGFYARTKMKADGLDGFIAVTEGPDNNYTYSIGKLSHCPFPIEELYEALNEAEGIEKGKQPRWGGSDLIGGSPRGIGSSLSPEEVQDVVNKFLDSHKGYQEIMSIAA